MRECLSYLLPLCVVYLQVVTLHSFYTSFMRQTVRQQYSVTSNKHYACNGFCQNDTSYASKKNRIQKKIEKITALCEENKNKTNILPIMIATLKPDWMPNYMDCTKIVWDDGEIAWNITEKD